MVTFLLKSFRSGISPYEDKGGEGAGKMVSGLDIRKQVDSLSCQQALISEGVGVVDTMIYFQVPASDGNTYGFGKGGKIYKRTSLAVYTLVYTDANGDIIGAGEFGCLNGKTYLWWATSTRLNCKEIPGNTGWSDVNASVVAGGVTYTYPKTDLTATTWHTMVQVNGSLQIANGEKIAMVGYDGSYSNNVVRLNPGDLANTLIERGLYSIFGCKRADYAGKAALYGWDKLSLNYNTKKNYPIASINAMIDTELPLMQVGTNGALFYSDMVNLTPVHHFPGGGQCNPDGVDCHDGLALFGVYGGGAGNTGVYAYGHKNFKEHPIAMALEYPLTCDEIGSVKKVGSDILVTYKNGTTYGVKRVDTANKATGYYDSLDLKLPATSDDHLYTAGKVVLFCAPLPASCALEVWYRMDKVGNFVQCKLPNTNAIQFTTTGGREAAFAVGASGKIAEVRIKLIPSGNYTPEVYRAEILFD